MQRSFWQSVRKGLGGRHCPKEQQLAAYADRQLIEEERYQVEHHLADCHACAQQVAFLARTAPEDDSEVTPQLLSKALALGRPAESRQIPLWALVASGAAAAAILVMSTIQVPRQKVIAYVPHPGRVAPSPAAAKPAINDAGSGARLRGSKDKTSPFIYPVAGQRVVSDHPVFRWSSSDQAESYEIELLTDSGTFVWSTRVRRSQVTLPSNIRLIAGRTYYLRLTIHQKNGTTQRIRAMGFIAG